MLEDPDSRVFTEKLARANYKRKTCSEAAISTVEGLRVCDENKCGC